MASCITNAYQPDHANTMLPLETLAGFWPARHIWPAAPDARIRRGGSRFGDKIMCQINMRSMISSEKWSPLFRIMLSGR